MCPLFAKCVAHTEGGASQHGNRGFEGLYLGPIRQAGNVVQNGHYVLRGSDKKVVKARTVDVLRDVSGRVQFPMREGRPMLVPSTAIAELEAGPTVVQMGEKFPPGTIVMTTMGPAEVLEKYEDDSGDYALKWGAGADGMPEVYTVMDQPAQLLAARRSP